jgi:hypothetical protein
MKKGILVLAAALTMIAPMGASAAVRVFVGHPYVGFGGWYAPYWGPYWGGPYPAYGYPNAGEVKLETSVKNADVFINGAFAGTTKQNKTMHLRPGNYNIEVREAGQTRFSQHVYVVAGKTLKLYPEL